MVLRRSGALRFRRSIHAWVTGLVGLMILAVALLVGFTVMATLRLQAMDHEAIEEQDRVDRLTQETMVVLERTEGQIAAPDPSGEPQREASAKLLESDALRLAGFPTSERGIRIATDYATMLETFIEYSREAVASRQRGELDAARRSHAAMMRTYTLLQDQANALFPIMMEDSNRLRSAADIVRKQNLAVICSLSLAVLLLAGILVFLVSRKILDPLETLTATAGRINGGDMAVQVPQVSRDQEFRRFTKAFNAMLSTIRGQIDEVKEAARLKSAFYAQELEQARTQSLLKETQLQVLQARINPHFQFNTLNMITTKAYQERATETAEMLESMAAMLQYVMAAPAKAVFLGDELGHRRRPPCFNGF